MTAAKFQWKSCPVAQVFLIRVPFLFYDTNIFKPGRVAQSIGHLTRKSEVLGSIPGLAAYFRFSFR